MDDAELSRLLIRAIDRLRKEGKVEVFVRDGQVIVKCVTHTDLKEEQDND